MKVLITYDVNTESTHGKRRLIRLTKECLKYGIRVQRCVFECSVEPFHFKKLQHALEQIIDSDSDSLRFYYIGSNSKARVDHIGRTPTSVSANVKLAPEEKSGY